MCSLEYMAFGAKKNNNNNKKQTEIVSWHEWVLSQTLHSPKKNKWSGAGYYKMEQYIFFVNNAYAHITNIIILFMNKKGNRFE